MYATYQNQHHIATCPVDFVIVVDFTSSKREKFKSHKFYFYSQQMLTYSQTASYFFFCATSLSSINRSQGEDSMDWKLNGARVYYCIMMRVCRNRPSEAAQVPRSDQPTSAKGKYLPLNSVLLLVLCALLFLFLLFWVFFCFILIRSFCIVSTANHRHVTLYPFLYVQVLYASFFGHVVSIVIVGWIWLCWRSKIKETSTTTMNEWTMSDTRSKGRQNIGKKIKRSQ